MPKIKTHKATVKRFTKTKTNKLIRRKAGQDHYNAGQTGKTRRNKRRDIEGNETNAKTIKSLMPYN